MKKMLILILLLSVSLLSACQHTNLDSRPDHSIAPPDNIYVGMPLEEFMVLYPNVRENPEGTCFYYWECRYAFFNDTNGNPVVVTFQFDSSYNGTVLSINAYDKEKINVNEETFSSLERGMSVQELVSILGTPKAHIRNIDGLAWDYGEDIEYWIALKGRSSGDDPDLVLSYICRTNKIDESKTYPLGQETWQYAE